LRHLTAEVVTVAPVPLSSLVFFRHLVVSVIPRKLSRERTFYREDRPEAVLPTQIQIAFGGRIAIITDAHSDGVG
jgi:hypothetical protein